MDSENVILHICSMTWHVVEFSGPHLILTSDRPIIMTNGMLRPGAHVGLPISPRQLFIAFNDEIGYRQVRALSPRNLIWNTNTKIVEQAVKYVYGFSDAELRLVAKGLGKRIPSTPLETSLLRIAAA